MNYALFYFIKLGLQLITGPSIDYNLINILGFFMVLFELCTGIAFKKTIYIHFYESYDMLLF